MAAAEVLASHLCRVPNEKFPFQFVLSRELRPVYKLVYYQTDFRVFSMSLVNSSTILSTWHSAWEVPSK